MGDWLVNWDFRNSSEDAAKWAEEVLIQLDSDLKFSFDLGMPCTECGRVGFDGVLHQQEDGTVRNTCLTCDRVYESLNNLDW